MLLPPKGWYDRHALPWKIAVVLGTRLRGSCMLGKHSINQAPSLDFYLALLLVIRTTHKPNVPLSSTVCVTVRLQLTHIQWVPIQELSPHNTKWLWTKQSQGLCLMPTDLTRWLLTQRKSPLISSAHFEIEPDMIVFHIGILCTDEKPSLFWSILECRLLERKSFTLQWRLRSSGIWLPG